MGDDSLLLRHRDRALALRTELAWLRGDVDILPMLAAEAETPTDVDLFIVALLDSFGRVLCKRLEDPVGYVTSWLAIEARLADAEKAADEADKEADDGTD
jgi:hypothetical protein